MSAIAYPSNSNTEGRHDWRMTRIGGRRAVACSKCRDLKSRWGRPNGPCMLRVGRVNLSKEQRATRAAVAIRG